jgi:hypothetical protein
VLAQAQENFSLQIIVVKKNTDMMHGKREKEFLLLFHSISCPMHIIRVEVHVYTEKSSVLGSCVQDFFKYDETIIWHHIAEFTAVLMTDCIYAPFFHVYVAVPMISARISLACA